jgi:hypothetical protein
MVIVAVPVTGAAMIPAAASVGPANDSLAVPRSYGWPPVPAMADGEA